jgi:hypothetical protein
VLTTAIGLTLKVARDGSYSIQAQEPNWTFGGSIGQKLTQLRASSGEDGIGAYQEITFNYLNRTRGGSIRAYEAEPIVLFNDTYWKAGENGEPFPQLSRYPAHLYHLGYAGRFAQYSFQTIAADSPRLYFDNQANAFLLSPASDFMLGQITRQQDGTLVSRIDNSIKALPQGFSHQTLLVITRGIHTAFDTWGTALTSLQKKQRAANDSSTLLNYLGYWTDRGASYYYKFDPRKGYQGTLLAVRDSFRQQGIPLNYMQLDSWWYPKGSARTWWGDLDPAKERGGIATYTADPVLFPQGLKAFQQQLGLPLITHARWIDASSTYRSQYSMSNNVITDPRYWDSRAAYLKEQGVIAYEQDWLDARALPASQPGDPAAFLDEMARAMGQQGLDIQYCMPLPRHFLQSTLYNPVTTIRVSDDRFQQSYWSNFLYTSQLASAVGLWPWSDVFFSKERDNLLLATLSAGPVGVGDAIGTESKANLFQAIRADGVIIKPDSPIVPTDQTYINDARGLKTPMVATSYTDHQGMKALYIFAYTRNKSGRVSYTPEKMGIRGPSYSYDYFTGTGKVLTAGQSDTRNIRGSDYTIIVPIGPSGIAFLGDAGKFISLGKKRITQLSDTGQVQIQIAFAANEGSVRIVGYAPTQPHIKASRGKAGQVSYNPGTHLFSCQISVGDGQSATVTISL